MGEFVTPEQAQNIALAAAKEGVRQAQAELFALLGVNIANSEAVEIFREDLKFAHALRTRSAALGARFVMTMVSIIASAIAIALWEGAKAFFLRQR